jgi:general L-amino acid transport system permease protein
MATGNASLEQMRSRSAGVRPPWRRPWIRAIAYQAIVLAAVVGLFAFFTVNVRTYLPQAGLALGWDFLSYPARFEIDDNLIGATARDPVWKAFLAGAANTVAVSLVSITMCIVLALLVALSRLSSNWLLSRTALVYIETVRNIPLLLQLLFWYGLSTIFPLPRDAWQPVSGIFVSNRGVFHPKLIMGPAHYWAMLAFATGLLLLVLAFVHARRQRDRTGQPSALPWYALALLFVLPTIVLLIAGADFRFDTPALKGFNFVGGSTISPEFVAVAAGLAVYQSGFTAETIRSGILGVRRGQIEAAQSLGLRPSQTLWLVTMPQALRIVIPPLTSQFLSLTKSSSLGVVVGYPELMRVTTAVISETGRAIECIAIIMSIYLALSLLTSALMNWYDRRVAYVER